MYNSDIDHHIAIFKESSDHVIGVKLVINGLLPPAFLPVTTLVDCNLIEIILMNLILEHMLVVLNVTLITIVLLVNLEIMEMLRNDFDDDEFIKWERGNKYADNEK